MSTPLCSKRLVLGVTYMFDNRLIGLDRSFRILISFFSLYLQLVSHNENSCSSYDEITGSLWIRRKHSTSVPKDLRLRVNLSFSHDFVAVIGPHNQS